MKEELISFETAKLAKEVGFDLEVRDSYSKNPKFNHHLIDEDYLENWNKMGAISAPTQSLLQRWLREKHKVLVWIKPVPNVGKWSVYVDDTIGRHLVADYIFKDTYEEALEAGLLEALKLMTKT